MILFNSIMLKIVISISILSFLCVLSGVLCNIWNIGKNFRDIVFEIGMTGLATMGFITLIMVGINLWSM